MKRDILLASLMLFLISTTYAATVNADNLKKDAAGCKCSTYLFAQNLFDKIKSKKHEPAYKPQFIKNPKYNPKKFDPNQPVLIEKDSVSMPSDNNKVSEPTSEKQIESTEILNQEIRDTESDVRTQREKDPLDDPNAPELLNQGTEVVP